MADSKDPISQNIEGVQQLVGSRTNKTTGGITNEAEGIEGEKEDELTLKLSDAELLRLADKWTLDYAGYAEKVKLRQEAQKQFYLGKQKDGSWNSVNSEGIPISANLLFEATETFLAAALAKNPEPVVFCDNSPEGNALSKSVKTMLQYHADVLALRPKLEMIVRKWNLDFLGVMKHGWDERIQDIKSEVKDAKDFVFDPKGYIDAYGDYIGPLGERITIPASKLIDMFPKHKAFITLIVDGKIGTDVTYTEWWNDDYCFYTFKGQVLEKNKNPNYNYPTEEDPEPKNHFAYPKKPYSFLSVFNLGNQPHDETGLIEQNIPNQKRITRRTEQIDYNLSRANNSTIYSGNNFNQENAKQAATARIKGHPIIVPAGGPIKDAIIDLPTQEVGSSFFDSLEIDKNDMRGIYGVQGITAQTQKEDTTARGMILNQQYDNSRIGGGIGSKIEHFVDNVFNNYVQLYYVHYNEPHTAAIVGQLKATEFIVLSNKNLNKQLVVSVAADSMTPKDDISEANQALALWEAKALDIKTLLTILNFPDPAATAAQAWLFATNPQVYGQLNFPELTQQIQELMAAQQPTAAPTPGGAPLSPSMPPAGQPPIGQPPEGLAGGAIESNSSLSQVPLPT